MSSSCQQSTRAATEATQTTISKDFPPIEKLPNRPLKISDLLGIFAAIKGIESDLSSGKRRCQAAIVQQIAAEIVLLYGKIGLQPVARSRQGQKDFAACTKPRNFQFSATNRDFLRFPRQIAKFPILRDKSRFFQSSAKNRAFSFKSEDQICAFSFKSEDQICAFSFKSEDQVCVFSIKSAYFP